MNIYARRGDKVVFAFPNYGYKYQQEEAAKLLKVGETYTVRFTVVGSSSTDIYLEEFPTHKLNSVLFADAPKVPAPDEFKPGIHITRVTVPKQGGFLALRCSRCRTTSFVYGDWFCQPANGDYFQVEGCDVDWRHNLTFPSAMIPDWVANL